MYNPLVSEDFGYLICYAASTKACSIRREQEPEQEKGRRFNGVSEECLRLRTVHCLILYRLIVHRTKPETPPFCNSRGG